jgi:small subunit ribosomal protein S2
VARAANAANAGRDEKPEPAASGQLAADEPMPEWERDLLQPSAGGESAPTA